ncbi:MAG TPA: type II toxin-antitoxin system VapC family toxin [Terriglobales bacterium]
MRLLLDTAVLIYAVNSPRRLSRRAARALENPRNLLEISSISLAEIAIKSSLGKLSMTAALARQAIRDLDLRILSYTGEHALELFDLPRQHSDPFDRQIIAQAISEHIPIITPDESFRLYKNLNLIW